MCSKGYVVDRRFLGLKFFVNFFIRNGITPPKFNVNY